MSLQSISPTAFFDKLKAPLKNARWSWGAVRPDGAVILRVWLDEIRQKDNREFVPITYNKLFEDQERQHAGCKERLEHLARIKNGAKSYMVICTAKDVAAIPRAIKTFNSNELFVGGRLREFEGDFWLEILGRIPVKDFY
jgi:hypothetical protein